MNITRDKLLKAFFLWERDCRLNPETDSSWKERAVTLHVSTVAEMNTKTLLRYLGVKRQ